MMGYKFQDGYFSPINTENFQEKVFKMNFNSLSVGFPEQVNKETKILWCN